MSRNNLLDNNNMLGNTPNQQTNSGQKIVLK